MMKTMTEKKDKRASPSGKEEVPSIYSGLNSEDIKFLEQDDGGDDTEAEKFVLN